MSFQSMPLSGSSRARAASSRILWTALGVAAVSLIAANAHAKDSSVPHAVVKYQDLNLSKHADAVTLYSRLQRASNSVCNDYDARELWLMPLREQCYEKALSEAVAQLNHSAVTALHDSGSRIRIARESGWTKAQN